MSLLSSLPGFGETRPAAEVKYSGALGDMCREVTSMADHSVPVGTAAIISMYPELGQEAYKTTQRVETIKDSRAAGATAVQQVRRTEQAVPAAELAVADRVDVAQQPAQPLQQQPTAAGLQAPTSGLTPDSVYQDLADAYRKAA